MSSGAVFCKPLMLLRFLNLGLHSAEDGCIVAGLGKLTALMCLQRLATGEWFTSRVSACGLFACAYRRAAPAHRAELRAMYRELCGDDTPMVRRAAASNLGRFAEVMEPEMINKELIQQFQNLTVDGEVLDFS